MGKEIKKGDLTDKGVVDKIVYLTFSGHGWPTGSYSDKPIKGGKGIICAQIGNKAIPISELKLLTTNPNHS